MQVPYQSWHCGEDYQQGQKGGDCQGTSSSHCVCWYIILCFQPHTFSLLNHIPHMSDHYCPVFHDKVKCPLLRIPSENTIPCIVLSWDDLVSRDGIRKFLLVASSVWWCLSKNFLRLFRWKIPNKGWSTAEDSHGDLISRYHPGYPPRWDPYSEIYVDSTGNWTFIVKSAVTDIQHSLRGKQLQKNVGTRMLCDCLPDDKTNDFQIFQNGMVANTNPRGKKVDKNQVLMKRMTWSGERIIQGQKGR